MDTLLTLQGYVGTDVEVNTGDGWCFARFRLACTPRFRRYDKWVDGTTTWLSVRCANRLAQNVRDSIHKGDPVIVIGRLRTQTWEADGQTQSRVVVEASAVGHDLGRGTTTFTKNEVVVEAESTDDDAVAAVG